MADKTEVIEKTAPTRAHRATFATDKRKGGYIIRVEAPRAAEFVGREIPVTLRDGTENTEKLVKLIWSGKDAESGAPCALYTFAPKPRGEDVAEF